MNGAGVDEIENRCFLLRGNAGEAECLDARDACNGRVRMGGPWIEPASAGLACVNDDVGVQEHGLNRGPAAGGPPAFHVAIPPDR